MAPGGPCAEGRVSLPSAASDEGGTLCVPLCPLPRVPAAPGAAPAVPWPWGPIPRLCSEADPGWILQSGSANGTCVPWR